MMKKIFCVVCSILLLMILSLTSYAVTPYACGDSFFSLKMNGKLSDENYWYLYYGKEGTELSEEMAYEGKTSMKVNIDKINEKDTSYPFMLHTRSVGNKNGISDSDIYCEVYSSSTDEVLANITFVVYFDMPDGNQKVFKEFITETIDSQWKKHSCVIDIKKVEGFSNCNIGVLFRKNTSLSGNFYIDNINMKTCPKSLIANDTFTDEKSVNLEEIRIFGIDKFGNKSLIQDKSALKYRVIDGDAEIMDNCLVSHLTQPGEIVLEADFLGKKTTFSVWFEGANVSLSEQPFMENQTVNLSLTNHGDEDAKITGLILIFADNGLYNGYIVTDDLSVGETGVIRKTINVPIVLKNSEIKFFFWDNSGEISEMIEVIKR